MSIYTSSTNRVTGLSGIDTDTMVDQLMTAESTKYNSLQRKQQWKTWQQDAFRTVIDKLKTFQSNYFSSANMSTNLKYSSALQNFKSSVLDSNGNEANAISVSKISNSGNYKVSVQQVATTTKYSGSKIDKSVTTSNSLDDIADAINNKEEMGFSVTYDGVTKNITLNRDTDFGGNADADSVFNAINQKLETAFGKDSLAQDSNGNALNVIQVTRDPDTDKITFATSSAGHSFSVSATNNYGSSVKGTFANINDENASDDKEERTMEIIAGDKTYEITVNVTGGETADQMAKKLNSALQNAKLIADDSDDPEDIDSANPKKVNISSYMSFSASDEENGFVLKSKKAGMEIQIANYGEIIDDVESDYLEERASLSDLGFDAATSNKINTSDKLENIFSKLENPNIPEDDEDFVVDENTDLSTDYLDKSGALTMTINGTTVSVGTDKSLQVMMEKINSSDMGVKLSYNSITEKFTLESAETGANSAISIGSGDADDKTTAILNDIFGIDTSNTADYQKGQDSIFTIDGVQTSRSSNDVEVDGLTFTINSTTLKTGADADINDTSKYDELTIKSEQDVDTTYEKIQGFVDAYNDIVTTLNGLVGEKRAKSDDYTYYEPLTTAEKDEMTESQIEQWEEKAKTGLLYKDSTISTFLSKMRSAMYGSVTLSNGKTTALYSIGITTSSDYTDNGKLVIDEDKLREAIEKNGDEITELFTKSGTGLADTLDKLLESAVGSKGTLREKAGIEGTASATENILSKEIKELNNKISDEKARLVKKETAYYKQFSAMESVINQQNTQMNTLTSLLSS